MDLRRQHASEIDTILTLAALLESDRNVHAFVPTASIDADLLLTAISIRAECERRAAEARI